MSSNVNMNQNPAGTVAPTPQNTPLTSAPIAQGLSRPTVPAISEDPEGEEIDAGDLSSALGGAALLQGAMSGLVHAKLAGLIGKSSGYIESLPVETKRNVEALKGVQVKSVELVNKYKRECLELEKKYNDLQKPLYDRRLAIITGNSEATSEEIAAGEEQSKADDPDYTPLSASISSPDAPKGIPDFWLTVLRNHVGMSELITERDAAALKSLRDIRLEYLPTDAPSAQMGFKLIFEFDKNDYFEDERLEKTYLYQEEVGYHGDLVYERAVGTEIKWKEEKDLTKEFEIKKQRNKNTNRTRLVRKARPTESFFNFFAPPVPPVADDEDEIDEDDLAELEEKLELDYQIGEDIKERIIPRAVDYFTGKALEYEDFDDEDDEDWEDDELDEDDDDEDGDEDDDDSDDVPVRRRPAKGRRGGGGGAGGGQQVNPDDCKQQ